MQRNRFGEVVETSAPTANRKAKKAILIATLIQLILIVINFLVYILPFVNMYFGILTAPIYFYMYVNFQKGCSIAKESVTLPAYCKWVSILSPIFYIITLILVLFGGS